ncbi:hypothetical protein IWQ61_000044 [Dispira simplex]|nr:hypothetical protein IWQ61_000044 [Dispira simplex]
MLRGIRLQAQCHMLVHGPWARRSLSTSLSFVASTPFAKTSRLITVPRTLRANNFNSSAEPTQLTTSNPPRVLVTGSLGQLGIGLVNALRNRYGVHNVVASDIRKPHKDLPLVHPEGPFVYADVLNYPLLERIVVDFQIDWIVHYSALLSAVAEKNPALALQVNVQGFQNVLELARVHKLRIFCPSTIGAFGPTTPKNQTPDLTIQRPNTIYGITKVHSELLGAYYHEKFNVDFRSLRYPGILSADTMAGGGTTDYAIDIFHQAIQFGRYTCFLRPDTMLPMMYITDCINGTVQFLETPDQALTQRVYNITADSFSPAQLAAAIRQKYDPSFDMTYAPDTRQDIADTWPASLDDSLARRDWGWKHTLDTAGMVDAMWQGVAQQYQLTTASTQIATFTP